MDRHHMASGSMGSMASMGSMTSMASMTMTHGSASSTSTGDSMMDMGHGGMDMGGDSCKMSMYWNWFTIDACFLSETWKITSRGMFAGSCIGVIILVIALEFVRRMQREYDRFIVREWKVRRDRHLTESSTEELDMAKTIPKISLVGLSFKPSCYNSTFQPTLIQQFIRSVFYMIQMGGAYIVMLLAMYYNGYIYFCILIGALLGFFFFGSDNITDGLHQEPAHSSTCC